MRENVVFRALVVLPLIVLQTAFWSTVIAVSVLVFRRPPIVGHRQASRWGRGVHRTSGVRVSIEGRERLDPDKTYIFAANHESQFDIFVLQGYFPHDFRWMAKKELLSIPMFGRAMISVGTVVVDRARSRAAVRSIDEAAARIAAGTPVFVFPEGTRSRNGRLQPLKLGAAVLAIKAGVPVVPVAILGSREVLPRDSWLPRPGVITLRMGEPIPTQGLTQGHKQELSDKVREELIGLGCVPGDSAALLATNRTVLFSST